MLGERNLRSAQPFLPNLYFIRFRIPALVHVNIRYSGNLPLYLFYSLLSPSKMQIVSNEANKYGMSCALFQNGHGDKMRKQITVNTYICLLCLVWSS